MTNKIENLVRGMGRKSIGYCPYTKEYSLNYIDSEGKFSHSIEGIEYEIEKSTGIPVEKNKEFLESVMKITDYLWDERKVPEATVFFELRHICCALKRTDKAPFEVLLEPIRECFGGNLVKDIMNLLQ